MVGRMATRETFAVQPIIILNGAVGYGPNNFKIELPDAQSSGTA